MKSEFQNLLLGRKRNTLLLNPTVLNGNRKKSSSCDSKEIINNTDKSKCKIKSQEFNDCNRKLYNKSPHCNCTNKSKKAKSDSGQEICSCWRKGNTSSQKTKHT